MNKQKTRLTVLNNAQKNEKLKYRVLMCVLKNIAMRKRVHYQMEFKS